MNGEVERLMKTYSGERVAGALIIKHEGKKVLAAKRIDGDWQLTKAGRGIAAAPKAETPAKRTRRAKRTEPVEAPVEEVADAPSDAEMIEALGNL